MKCIRNGMEVVGQRESKWMEGGEVCEEWEGSGRAEGVEVDGRGSGWNGVDGVSLSVIWGNVKGRLRALV